MTAQSTAGGRARRPGGGAAQAGRGALQVLPRCRRRRLGGLPPYLIIGQYYVSPNGYGRKNGQSSHLWAVLPSG